MANNDDDDEDDYEDDDAQELSGDSSNGGKSTGIGGGTMPIRPTLSARSVTQKKTPSNTHTLPGMHSAHFLGSPLVVAVCYFGVFLFFFLLLFLGG